jgi:acetyl esterase/lipase
MPSATRRTFHHFILSALGMGVISDLPSPALAADAQDLGFVHPELRPAAAQLLKLVSSMPELSAETLAITRQAMGGWAQPPLATPAWEQRQIAGLPGQPAVSVYLINSDPKAKRPAILHTHGGGYVAGRAKDMLGDLQRLALELDCTIVTVDYRLAPETDWRGSTSDTYAALQWLHDEAVALGVDAARIAVMGESAGGGHAALLALKAREIGKIPLVAQILIYPMLDDRTGTTITPPAPVGTIVWNSAKNRFGWQSFLGQAPATAQVPADAVPARHKDLSGLPPTFIGVGTIDLFADEDVAYAQRLKATGVPVQLELVQDAFHGFDGIGATTKVAKDFTAMKVQALRRAFTR